MITNRGRGNPLPLQTPPRKWGRTSAPPPAAPTQPKLTPGTVAIHLRNAVKLCSAFQTGACTVRGAQYPGGAQKC
eukprot:6282531-Karenia_brevis.AAC.1